MLFCVYGKDTRTIEIKRIHREAGVPCRIPRTAVAFRHRKAKTMRLLNYMKKIVRFNDFNGGDYFKTLDAIDRFIAQNKLACDFTSLIEAKQSRSQIHLSIISSCKCNRCCYRDNATTKAYKYYQVATNSEALDNYLANLLPG